MHSDPSGLYTEDVHYHLTYYLGLILGLPDAQASTIAMANQYADVDARIDSLNLAGRAAWLEETNASHNPFVRAQLKPLQPYEREINAIRQARQQNPNFVLANARAMVAADQWEPFVRALSEVTFSAIPYIAWRVHFPAKKETDAVFENSSHATYILDKVVSGTVAGGRNAMIGIGLHSLQDSYSHHGFNGKAGHGWNEGVDDVSTNVPKARAMALRTYDKLSQATRGSAATTVPDVLIRQLNRIFGNANRQERIRLLGNEIRAVGGVPAAAWAQPGGFNEAVIQLQGLKRPWE